MVGAILAESYLSLSPYVYCANNPIRYIDPDGKAIDWYENPAGMMVYNDDIHSQKDMKERGIEGKYKGATYTNGNIYYSLFGEVKDLTSLEGMLFLKIDEAICKYANYDSESEEPYEPSTDFNLGVKIKRSALGLAENNIYKFNYGGATGYYFVYGSTNAMKGRFIWYENEYRPNSFLNHGIKGGYNARIITLADPNKDVITLVFPTLYSKKNYIINIKNNFLSNMKILILPIFVCLCINTNKEYKYPFLENMLGHYYVNHYDYPIDADELVNYIRRSNFVDHYDSATTNIIYQTLEKISLQRNCLKWEKRANQLIFKYAGEEFYSIPMDSPCKVTLLRDVYYIERVLFFDNQDFSFQNDSLWNKFHSERKKIRMDYKEILLEKDTTGFRGGKDIPKYVMLKYEPHNGLTFFCENETLQMSEYPYFKELESFTADFSKKHRLSKIIFASMVFYDEWLYEIIIHNSLYFNKEDKSFVQDMLIMKIWMIIFIIYFSFSSCKEEYKYPFLENMIDAYFWDHYNYPDDILELINYIKNSSFMEYYDSTEVLAATQTLNKLFSQKNIFKFEKKEGELIFILNKKKFYSIPMDSPCDANLRMRGSIFIGQILFFDDQKISFQNDSLWNEFNLERKKIRKNYNKYLTEKVALQIGGEIEVKKDVLLKYEPNNGLTFFCENETIKMSEYPYFKELESFTADFSKKHRLSKIIFASMVFYDELL